MSATLSIGGGVATVRFDGYDLDSYATFLRCKGLPESSLAYDWERDAYVLTTPARYAALLGAEPARADEAEALPFSEALDDYQVFVVNRALRAQRFAAWLDTGLGKTRIFLEWARQVMWSRRGKVLIFSPLQVIGQTIAEAAAVYGQELTAGPGLRFQRLDSREELAAWLTDGYDGLGITNYEKLIPGEMPELRHLAGIVLDESSVLKSGGGVIKWNLIHSAKGIPYKLSATATPAPNDAMEYASQASFLDKFRSEGEVLWTFYSRNKAGEWQVKPHAREAFYRWMADWSLYMRDPAHFGYRDVLAELPEPEIIVQEIPLTDEQTEAMRALQVRHGMGLLSDHNVGIQQRLKLSQLAKGFVYGKGQSVTRVPSLKPRAVAETARAEILAGRQCLIWTVFDEEAAIIAEELNAAGVNGPNGIAHAGRTAVLDGRTPERGRVETLQAFRRGDIDVLVSKAQLLGYGLNFQHCTSTIFSGFDDSFERLYQAQRRFVRRGQTETVRIHVPVIPELEGLMFDNLKAKEAAYLRDVETMERHYIAAMGREVG